MDTSDDEATGPAAGLPLLEPWFAAIGASAGLFVMLGIGAVRPHLDDGPILFTTVVSLVVGAAIGAILTRWRALDRPLVAPELRVIGLTAVLALGGAVVGLCVGIQCWDEVSPQAVGGGALLALVFAPSCHAILEAARRSRRARHGSIIAAADRRTIFTTFFAGLAATTLVTLPAFLSGNASTVVHTPSQVAVAVFVALIGLVGVGVAWVLDRKGMRSLRTFADQAADLEPAHEGTADAQAIDLGLGDEAWTKRRAATYRTSDRGAALLRGSLDEALTAMRETSWRRGRAALLCLVAIGVAVDARLAGDPHCSRCATLGIAVNGCASLDDLARRLPPALGAPFRMQGLDRLAHTDVRQRAEGLAAASYEWVRARRPTPDLWRRFNGSEEVAP